MTPTGAGTPTPLVEVDVVVSLDVVSLDVVLLEVVSLDVVLLEVVRLVDDADVVVFVLELGEVLELSVVEGLGGVDGGAPPPHPCALPLLPVLPQLPLSGFSPLPGLSSAVSG